MYKPAWLTGPAYSPPPRSAKLRFHQPRTAMPAPYRRSSDLNFRRGESPKLLEMARTPASALPARPSLLHRCSSRLHCRICGRTSPRRPGGRGTPGRARTRVGWRGHPGCRRPGSRRCCSPSDRWPQASLVNARPPKFLAPARERPRPSGLEWGQRCTSQTLIAVDPVTLSVSDGGHGAA
jgi:hypothetical protein